MGQIVQIAKQAMDQDLGPFFTAEVLFLNLQTNGCVLTEADKAVFRGLIQAMFDRSTKPNSENVVLLDALHLLM